MGSIIPAILCTLAALWLAGASFRRIFVAQARWDESGSPVPVVIRWLWMVTVACCALTCLTFATFAIYQLASRWLAGALEASLSSRWALYTSLTAYGLAWMQGRAVIKWPHRRPRGPKLLPPAGGTMREGDGE
ncbi:MAG: hypothetical protein ABFE16_13720 [Armatimonadia bacterium]